MSGVKQYNPNSRATEIIAALALREPLHSIERICDEQKQISTGRLYAYATEAGDKLAGYACELRQAITSLRQDHAEAQRLLRENDALAQRCRELEHAATNDLLTRLLEQLDASNAKNYHGAEFDVDLGSEQMTAVVMLQRRGHPSAHDLRLQAEAQCDTLRAEVERLRAIREIANQCAANGGYLSSDYLIELRELLRR